jgi:ferredoxin
MVDFSNTTEARNLMAYKVTDACVNCGACESECPVEAISEKDGARWIDPAKCQDCGACTGCCPTEAIVEG